MCKKWEIFSFKSKLYYCSDGDYYNIFDFQRVILLVMLESCAIIGLNIEMETMEIERRKRENNFFSSKRIIFLADATR